MLEEPEKVVAAIDEAATKSLHTMVSALTCEEDAMLHEWLRVVLETSV